MTKRNMTSVALSATVRAMARMGAGRAGITLATYLERLIRKDAQQSGIADLVADADQEEARDDG